MQSFFRFYHNVQSNVKYFGIKEFSSQAIKDSGTVVLFVTKERRWWPVWNNLWTNRFWVFRNKGVPVWNNVWTNRFGVCRNSGIPFTINVWTKSPQRNDFSMDNFRWPVWRGAIQETEERSQYGHFPFVRVHNVATASRTLPECQSIQWSFIFAEFYRLSEFTKERFLDGYPPISRVIKDRFLHWYFLLSD